jgi:hypothetical protein
MTVPHQIANPPHRYGLRQVVKSERIKLLSVRSTPWVLGSTLVAGLLVTALATNGTLHHAPQWYRGFDPTNQSLSGLAIGLLVIGVLGVLAASGEYSSGTIRSTLAAAPRRPLLLGGKIAVVGALAVALGEVLSFACFGLGQAILHAGGAPTASLAQHGVLQAILLSGVFIGLLGLLGLGLGVIIRHSAGAIAAYAGITLLSSLLLSRLPDDPSRFTPAQMLANSVSTLVGEHSHVNPWLGVGLMAIYTLAVLALASAVIVRRDA